MLMPRRPPVGRRIVDGGAEFSCGVPAPAGVVEHAGSQRDLVRLSARDDLSGCWARVIRPTEGRP
jgi:hypothetical protein